jgi:hypothetical protein
MLLHAIKILCNAFTEPVFTAKQAILCLNLKVLHYEANSPYKYLRHTWMCSALWDLYAIKRHAQTPSLP